MKFLQVPILRIDRCACLLPCLRSVVRLSLDVFMSPTAPVGPGVVMFPAIVCATLSLFASIEIPIIYPKSKKQYNFSKNYKKINSGLA